MLSLRVALLLCGTVLSLHAQDALYSVLWTQTAVEHGASLLQAYRLAEVQLDLARKDKKWTAALEQQGDPKLYRKLPPAVILDLDETVFDNSPFQARMIEQGKSYDPQEWFKWSAEARATALPGALEFARHAEEKKVALFYVTNREPNECAATAQNIRSLGLPLPSLDRLVCRAGVSDKGPRRTEIARRYRILLLIGDDLNDFLSGARGSVAERQALSDKYASLWGTRWIVLPNAMYGSWEAALQTGGEGAPDVRRRRWLRR